MSEQPEAVEAAPELPSLDDWAEALSTTVAETGPGLGFEVSTAVVDEEAPLEAAGVMLPLVAEYVQIQIGLLGQYDSLEALARGLMMMEPDEELSREDSADAVGEILNVVVGVYKSAMVDRVPTLRLGLPVFAEGIHHRKTPRRLIRCVYGETEFTVSVATKMVSPPGSAWHKAASAA